MSSYARKPGDAATPQKCVFRNQPSKFGFLRKSSQQALVVSTTSFKTVVASKILLLSTTIGKAIIKLYKIKVLKQKIGSDIRRTDEVPAEESSVGHGCVKRRENTSEEIDHDHFRRKRTT